MTVVCPMTEERPARGGFAVEATTDVQEIFREAMAGLCSGVAVVTGMHPNGRPCGLLATSVSSFSANPPSVMASIAHTSGSHDSLTTGPGFAVNILSAEQERLGRIFSTVGRDKFAEVDWEFDHGLPKLAGALSFLSCELSTTFKHHDHTVIVGDVVAGSLGSGAPLVYMARSMRWRLAHPQSQAA
jgi:flavin reductase (DIM6/NTAB) family NADH-FMN oxidoreductase RutF